MENGRGRAKERGGGNCNGCSRRAPACFLVIQHSASFACRYANALDQDPGLLLLLWRIESEFRVLHSFLPLYDEWHKDENIFYTWRAYMPCREAYVYIHVNRSLRHGFSRFSCFRRFIYIFLKVIFFGSSFLSPGEKIKINTPPVNFESVWSPQQQKVITHHYSLIYWDTTDSSNTDRSHTRHFLLDHWLSSSTSILLSITKRGIIISSIGLTFF